MMSLPQPSGPRSIIRLISTAVCTALASTGFMLLIDGSPQARSSYLTIWQASVTGNVRIELHWAELAVGHIQCAKAKATAQQDSSRLTALGWLI